MITRRRWTLPDERHRPRPRASRRDDGFATRGAGGVKACQACHVEHVERLLKKLQAAMRQGSPRAEPDVAETKAIPRDLTGNKRQYVLLSRRQKQLLAETLKAIEQDLRFEHLKGADAILWRFAAQSIIQRNQDHVASFATQYQLSPVRRRCFFQVEHLKVKLPISIMGVELLPIGSADVPQDPAFAPTPTAGCYLAIWVEGTDLGKMADRARVAASSILRSVRLCLRDITRITPSQLRFRLSETYLFDDGAFGFVRDDGHAYDFELLQGHVDRVLASPLSSIDPSSIAGLPKQLALAAKWIERSWLTDDPLSAILYLFFSLEAILGDRSKGEKAHILAFRQATLSYIANGHFEHPDSTVLLYDEVRSVAVHGGEVQDVSWILFLALSDRINQTLKDYIVVAQRMGITNRRRMIELIDGHEDRGLMIARILEFSDDMWKDFVSSFTPIPPNDGRPSAASE